MNRKEYNDLVRGVLNDMQQNAVASYVVDRVLEAAGVETPEPPISEQIWNSSSTMPEGYDIDYNGRNIAWVRTDALRDIVINIPALLKVCEKIDSDCDFPDSDGDCFVDGTLVAALRKVLSEINN